MLLTSFDFRFLIGSLCPYVLMNHGYQITAAVGLASAIERH